MSRTVDQRVVEMKFDNRQFESAVTKSRRSITLVNKDLKSLSKDGMKALYDLDRSFDGFDPTNFGKSINRIKDSFTTLGVVGMSIVNRLTNDAITKFQEMGNKVIGIFSNLANQVYTRGYNRAKNLESSAFKIEGLLKRADLSSTKSLQVQSKLTKMISDSVDDTAFGLDSASLAASTLASTFGTDERALNNIKTSLYAIAGVAGTTGASYEQVADIFTDVAGQGRAMGMQFQRMSLLGISAQEEVAKYANKELKVRQKLNKVLGNNAMHELTGADILTAASKKAISAEIFSKAFEGFIETAKEANNTMDGVTSNIGAAMGRLGASFIQPIIQNSGPLVQFLQVVKSGISELKNQIEKFEIPQNITDFFNQVIVVAKDHLKDFIEEFKKGNTPLNTFIENIGKVVDKLTLVFSLFKDRVDDNKKSDSINFDKYLGMEAEQDKDIQKGLEKNSKNYNKSVKDYRKIVDKKHKNWSKEKKQREAERMYMAGFNKDEAHSLSAWEKVYKKRVKSSFMQSDEYKNIKGKNKKQTKSMKKDALNAFLDSDSYKMQVKAGSVAAYNKDIQTLIKNYGDLDKLTKLANRDLEETKIFGFDYVKEFIEGFKNIGKAIGNIFGTIGDALEGINNPLSNFFKIFSGGDEETKESRKALKDFSVQFKETTGKIAELAKSDGVKFFVSDIGKYLAIFSKVFGGVFKVVVHAIKAFQPLISRILDGIARVFGLFSSGSDDVSLFDKAINFLCKAIDWLAELLDKLWFKHLDFIEWIKDTGIDKFTTKIKDLTGGFIDLTKPAKAVKDFLEKFLPLISGTSDETKKTSDVISKAGDTMEKAGKGAKKVSDAVDSIKTGFSSLSKSQKGKTGVFDKVADTFDKVAKPAEKAGDAIGKVSDAVNDLTGNKKSSDDTKSTTNTLSWIQKITQWFKDKFSNISPETVKSVFNTLKDVVVIVGGILVSVGIYRGIQKIGTGVENITASVRGYDVKAERYKHIADILKGIALIIAAFAIGVVLITKSISVLGKMDTDALWRGIGAFLIISAVVGVLIFVVMMASKSLVGEKSGVNFKGMKASIGGIFDFQKANNSSISSMKESAFDPLIAVAGVILVFAIGVRLIASAISKLGEMASAGTLEDGMTAFITIAAVIILLVGIVMLTIIAVNSKSEKSSSMQLAKGKTLAGMGDLLWGVAAVILVFAMATKTIAKSLKTLATLPSGSGMDDAIDAFVLISGSILILVIATLAFTALITRKQSKNTSGTLKSMSNMLFGIAAIMAVFAFSVKKIMKSIANLAIVGKFADLDKAIDAFTRVSLAIVGIVAIVAILSAIILKDKSITPAKIKALTPILACIALITLALGVSVGLMMLGISVAAAALKGSSESELMALETLMVISFIAIIGIVAILMASISRLKGLTKAQATKIEGIFAIIGGIIFVVAIAMFGIGYAAKNMKGIDNESMWGLVAALGILAALVTVLALVGILAGKANLKTGPMIALAAMIAVLGIIFIALGTAIVLISNALDANADSVELFKQVAIIFGILLGVCAIIAVLASKGGITTKGLLVVAGLLAVLGLVFTAIGKMALNIGKGALLLQTAIERFMNSINRFADMDDKRIEKGAKKVGKGVKDLLIGVVDGIIEFGETVGGKKDALTAAITKILDVIQGAITTFFVTLETNILDRLGQLIDKLEPWLEEYRPKIINVLNMLWDIVWLGALQPILTDLGTYIWNGIKGIVKYLSNEENTTYLGDKLIGMFVSIMHGLVEGIKEHRDELVECIQNLIYELINIIFKFFGIPYEIPVTWKAKTTSEKANLDQAGAEIPGAIGDGIKGSEQQVVDIAESFIGKVTKAILEGLSNLLLAASDKLADFWMHIFNPEVEDYDKEMDQVAKDREAAYKLLDEYNQKIEAGMSHGLAASTVLNKTTNQAQRDILEKWGIKSPSKFTTYVGKQVDQGMANGLNTGKALDAVKNTTEEMQEVYRDFDPPKQDFSTFLKNAGETFKKTLPKMQKVIEESGLFDSDKFIIKPGMDLSNITKDSKQLQKIFDGVGLSNVNASEAIGIFDNLKSGNFNKIDVSSLANGFDSANDKNGKKSSSSDNSSLGSINFTQNNYSPKSLSQIDIYRQTENLLGKKSTLNSLASSVGLTGTNF
ncbi:MAG: hypothetical protein J6Y02_23650 [Pseudobutyrivibrio sp.]|nr:hypothetical protein [Pseudobutyrivibrio sp.]